MCQTPFDVLHQFLKMAPSPNKNTCPYGPCAFVAFGIGTVLWWAQNISKAKPSIFGIQRNTPCGNSRQGFGSPCLLDMGICPDRRARPSGLSAFPLHPRWKRVASSKQTPMRTDTILHWWKIPVIRSLIHPNWCEMDCVHATSAKAIGDSCPPL